MGNKIKLSTAVYSDVGKIRKSNEDSFYLSQKENLIIVCDGMGGQVAGGLASKIAVETIKDVYEGLGNSDVDRFLYDLSEELTPSARKLVAAVRLANRRLYRIATKFIKLRGMGTTVVALSLDKSFATMVHVGDSRILRLSNNQIHQLTEDHSWLNELIEDNEINEEQVEVFTQKNVITRALGTSPTVKIDIHCEKYKKDDIYILCTDGLHSSISNDEIKRFFGNNDDLDLITKKLIEKANHRDGTDNITVAIAQIGQNSKPSKFAGTSITIYEEGDKGIAREDKFIDDKYGEPKLNVNQNPIVNAMSQNKLIIPGLVLLTGLLCFVLGMFLQTVKFNAKNPPTVANEKVAAVVEKPKVNKTVNDVPPLYARSNSTDAVQSLVIQRSELNEDAVLAVVFFNSRQDYHDAMLEKRGDVLDKLHPYKQEDGTSIQGSFSIFLIDSSNNVIRKTAGLRLPDYPAN